MTFAQHIVQHSLMRPFRKLGLAAARHWPWPVAVRLANRRSIYVDIRSSIGRALFMKGEFDPAVLDPLREQLKPGDTFVDVGANVGYYGICALDLAGGSGRVHAFEVDARPLRCLRRTIMAGRISNLHLHEIAVTDEDGTARLVARGEAGHSSVDKGAAGPAIPTTTLDSWQYKQGVGRIAAIKIDVEGGELRVLRGAHEMIKRDRPLIVCEAVEENLRKMGGSTEELLHLLNSAGYCTQWLDAVWTPIIVARPGGEPRVSR